MGCPHNNTCPWPCSDKYLCVKDMSQVSSTFCTQRQNTHAAKVINTQSSMYIYCINNIGVRGAMWASWEENQLFGETTHALTLLPSHSASDHHTRQLYGCLHSWELNPTITMDSCTHTCTQQPTGAQCGCHVDALCEGNRVSGEPIMLQGFVLVHFTGRQEQ